VSFVIVPEAFNLFSISDRGGGVHGGGGRRVAITGAGYDGPEFKYQYPPATKSVVPPAVQASVRREKTLDRTAMSSRVQFKKVVRRKAVYV